MYVYVSSLAKQRHNGQSYTDANLANVTFADIDRLYSDVIFKTSTNFTPGPAYLTLETLKAFGVVANQTVSDYFGLTVQDKYIPCVTTPYELSNNTVSYKDALQAGYTWEHVDKNSSIVGSPITDRPDLNLIRGSTDYSALTNHVIFTVNGLAHRCVFDNNRCIILNGTRSMLTANRNSVGMISFSDIGAVTQIGIDDSMLSDPADTNGYWNNLYIKTGHNLTNKSVILSFAGYLHVADDVCRIVNREEGVLRVDISKLPLLERLMDLRQLINLVSVPISSYAINEGAVKLSDLKDDAVIKALFTLPQSFVAIVDTPSLYRRMHPLESAGLYNVYLTHDKPKWPVQMHFGLYPEVWTRQEYDRYVLTCHHPLKRNLMTYTAEYRDEVMVTDGANPTAMYFRDTAYQVEIGTETITWPTP